ncbi:MAG: hypothetical protein ACOX1V_03260 [Candidatus Iainarchaeum sp.]|jgi:hypothetical protein|nr:MAG: hypothetical protein BWY55_00944 [archaeon ADurb.Bin336]
MSEGMEQIALNYFHNLPKSKKMKIMKEVVGLLEEDEKVELAKMLLKKLGKK